MADEPNSTPSLGDRLSDLFRTSAGAQINISAASRSLGVSRDTIRRMLAGSASSRGEAALHRAEKVEQRRPQWIAGAHQGKMAHKLFPDGMPKMPGERDIPGQIGLLANRKPDGSINLTRTAKALGVSARTLARWVKGEARPRAAHQEQIRGEVRATLLANSDAAMDAATRTGMSLQVFCMVQISDDLRRRRIAQHLDTSQVAAAQLAWMNGGDEGLQTWVATSLENNYFHGISAEVTDVES